MGEDVGDRGRPAGVMLADGLFSFWANSCSLRRREDSYELLLLSQFCDKIGA